MNRPMYENKKSLDAEQEIVEKIATDGLSYRKLPISYQVDYALTRGVIVKALLEVKDRNMKYGQYPDVILSVHKYEKGTAYSKLLDVPFFFAVRMTDGIYMAQMNGKYKVSYTGRTRDTRDSADIEMVIHVPMADFVEVL